MPNVTSETHRKWCFWLLFPLAAAMNFSYLYIRSPNRQKPWKKSPPGGETPCLWRTEKPQNCTPKMPNVTSETHRKWCFWLLFPLAAAMNFSYLYIRSPTRKRPWKKSPPGGETPCLWRTEKHQNCTPKMPNVTSETHRKWCFWLLFPLAAAMNFSYLYIRSPNRKTPWQKSPPGGETPCLWRTGQASKKAAPGSKTPWLWRTEKHQNCTPKMPNVTSETHRKWCFWLLFPLAAAMNFSYLYIRSPNRKTPWKKSPPGGETPCLWRTEKPQNCTPKMLNVTSETHRKWCFWLLFPLAAAMNFSYLYIRSPNRQKPWKKSPPGAETPCLWRTEKPQNCTPKMPNVTSETHRKWCFWPRKCLTWLLKPIENDAFGSFFLLLLPWILVTFTSGPQIGKHHGKNHLPGAKHHASEGRVKLRKKQLPAAKHHGSEGRRSPKIVPRKCLTWLLKPIENDAFCSFFLLLLPWILATFTSGPQIGKDHGKNHLPGAKHHASEGRRSPKIVPRKCLTWLLKPIENDAFGSFFLLLLPWILATFTSGPQIGKHNGKNLLPGPKHHASEGRRSPKIAPRKCLTWLLKPIENDAFGSFFLLLLPWILATFTSGPQIGKDNAKKSPPGGETPCLWRTEKPQNCTPKMPKVTSETHRKWCFWLLFPLAAAMNFSYLYIRSPNRKRQWKKSPPGGETPCLWRTEKPQNCTPKMPNVTSETHRKWCFWLLFPLAAAMNFSYLYIRSPNRQKPWKKSPPGAETPCLWRTEKPQNCTPKMPNVTSETHRKWCFWLLFPLAAAMNFSYLYIRSPNRKRPWKKSPPGGETPCLWRTEKPQNCTPKMPNVTSETHRKWCFWLLFPLAAAMNFSYLYIRSPNRKTPWQKSPPGGETPCLWRAGQASKKAAPGSKTPWLWRTEKPQNCTPKMPNVTSETHRKWCFWLLFPLAAAMNFSYLYIRSPNRKTPWKKSPPGGETPCLWRTEKPQNCTPKMLNVTSETHRKWCFWLLFPLAAAMNFSYLYIRSPNRQKPWKKSPPGAETPCLWRTEKPQNCTPKMP